MHAVSNDSPEATAAKTQYCCMLCPRPKFNLEVIETRRTPVPPVRHCTARPLHERQQQSVCLSTPILSIRSPLLQPADPANKEPVGFFALRNSLNPPPSSLSRRLPSSSLGLLPRHLLLHAPPRLQDHLVAPPLQQRLPLVLVRAPLLRRGFFFQRLLCLQLVLQVEPLYQVWLGRLGGSCGGGRGGGCCVGAGRRWWLEGDGGLEAATHTYQYLVTHSARFSLSLARAS